MSPVVVPPVVARRPQRAAPGTAEAVVLLDVVSDKGRPLPCRTHDPDLWFAESPADLERAKQLCAGCPIRIKCLTGALARGEPWGVWGGEILQAGTVLARKRPRGRPRKHDVGARQ